MPALVPIPRDILTALALLTRLPVRATFDRTSAAAWAWPLAGVAVGAVAGGAGLAGLWAGLPVPVVAAGILTVQIFLTGAMHEDGLADCADGFWGGWARERRLEIMRDSHVGTYGVLALGLSLIARWAALASVLPGVGAGGLLALAICTGAVSRAAMLAVAVAMPHARRDGLSVATGRPGRWTGIIGVALAVAFVSALPLPGGVAAILAAGGAAGAVGFLARVKIGGQTGDVLGATQQAAEIAILATLSTFAPA